MMPRFSPPTAMGLPRKRGSAACSTDGKESVRVQMDNGLGHESLSFALAYQRNHHALNDQFPGGEQLGISSGFRRAKTVCPCRPCRF